MTLQVARIGGASIVAGSVAFLIAFGMVLGNQAVGPGVQSIGGLIVDLGLILSGVGALVVAAAGQGPLAGASCRVGLASLALGCLTVLASSILIRSGGQSYLPLGLVAVGSVITILGWLVTGIALTRRAGPSRMVGRALVAGVALMPIVVFLANLEPGGLRFGMLVPPVASLMAALLLGGMAGIGYLALSDRWSWR